MVSVVRYVPVVLLDAVGERSQMVRCLGLLEDGGFLAWALTKQ